MDTDNSGVLSKNEVKQCLGAAGFDKKFIKVREWHLKSVNGTLFVLIYAN